MYVKGDMMNSADKDLVCEFLYASVGRVLNKSVTSWERAVPQGVSVYMAHPDRGTFEYLFTKDDKYPVALDGAEDVLTALHAYGNVDAGGVVMYMNRCMLPIASKHKRFWY